MTQRETVLLGGLEPILTEPASLSTFEDARLIDLDMRAVTFVCPLDLVAIATWSLSLAKDARGEVLLADSPTSSYLERMKLLEQLREHGWKVPAVSTGPWDDLADRLLEVTPLSGPHDVEALGDRLPKLWKGKTGDLGKNRALHFAFGELSDNATSHSGDSPIFVAAQRYSGSTSPRPARLELAVGDAGVGIPAHLRMNPTYAHVTEDKKAILLALKPGVSGTRHRRGYGFHDVVQHMTVAGPGELTVISARARVESPFGQNGRRRVVRDLSSPVDGTWVQVRVHE